MVTTKNAVHQVLLAERDEFVRLQEVLSLDHPCGAEGPAGLPTSLVIDLSDGSLTSPVYCATEWLEGTAGLELVEMGRILIIFKPL